MAPTQVRFRIVGLVILVLMTGVWGSVSVARAADAPVAMSDAALQALFTAESSETIKCLTPHVGELQRRQLSIPLEAARVDTFVHETQHFAIYYYKDGSNAVDLTDADSNNVPDYIDWTAEAYEESWTKLVVELGYGIDLAGGKYVVRVQLTGSAYGWTELFPTPGGTRITMHSDFAGFYAARPNLTHDDPDGLVRGAIRVTAAHEWKHALQFADGWNFFEPGAWPETDATWVEDIVYDFVNDYYNFITAPWSPFTNPEISLISASYEDCTWQHYISEKYGLAFVRDYSTRRGIAPSTSQQIIWLQTAQGAGEDWAELWRDYSTWNYLTGTRGRAGVGFGEAMGYPTSKSDSLTVLPLDMANRQLKVMAMEYFRFDPLALAAAGTISVDFAGQITAPWGLTLVYSRADSIAIVPVPLVNEAVQTVVSGYDVADFDEVAILVADCRVGSTSNEAQSYSLRVELIPPVATRSTSMSGLKSRY